jgi:hypothetical protein
VHIWLRGRAAVAYIVLLAVAGFLLALGGVLDAFDAHWKIAVPLTVLYAVLIWCFAWGPYMGDAKPSPTWPPSADMIVGRSVMTLGSLFATLFVISATYDLYLTVLANWHYLVVALVLMAVIVGIAMLLPKSAQPRD